MTNRERILAVLQGKQPDRVPWCADMTYWYPWARETGICGPETEGNGYIPMHKDYGVGFYLQGFFPYKEHFTGNITEKVERNGYQVLDTITTPVGSVSQLNLELPKSYTSAIKEHFIKSAKDLEVYAYIKRHTEYEPMYDEVRHRMELVEDNGVTLCYLPKSPMMQLIALDAGIETVTDLSMDEEDLFEETIEALRESHDRAARIATDSPAECLMIPENISSEVVGKRFYHNYMKSYHQKWCEEIEKNGKYSFVHLDGTMRGLITELSKESHFRVIEALTPAPVGDVEYSELRSLTAEETVLWGGLPGIYLTDLVSDQEFDAYLIKVLSIMTKSKNCVLGVGDQIPPGSRPERIRRVYKLVEEYGYY